MLMCKSTGDRIIFTGDFSSLPSLGCMSKAIRYLSDEKVLDIEVENITVNKYFLRELLTELSDYKSDSRDKKSTDVDKLLDMFDNASDLPKCITDLYKNDVVEYDIDAVSDKFVHKAKENQKEFLTKYLDGKKEFGLTGLLLDAAPGTGKTFMSELLVETLEIDFVFVIAPLNTIKTVWMDSIESDYKDQPTHSIITESYTISKYNIVNYEKIPKMDELITQIPSESKVMIIVDEAHNMTTKESGRVKSLLDSRVFKLASEVLLLSGTPVRSNTEEIDTMIRILNKRVPERELKILVQFYEFVSTTKLKRIRYSNMSHRIDKSVLTLPPITVEHLEVRLKNSDDYIMKNVTATMEKYKNERVQLHLSHREEYYKQFLTIVNELTDSKTNNQYLKYVDELYKINKPVSIFDLASRVKYLTIFEDKYIYPRMSKDEGDHFMDIQSVVKYPWLKANGEALGRVLTPARIQCFSDIAKNISYEDIIAKSNSKVVIFSSYIEVCESICKVLDKKKIKYSYIFGDNTKSTDRVVSDFMDPNGDTRVMVATYKALGTGVRLTSASTVVMIDIPFRHYIYDQAISRVWRLGQTNNVKLVLPVLYTFNELNLSTRNYDIIDFYNNKVEYMTGNTNDFTVRPDDKFFPNSAEIIDENEFIHELGNEKYRHKLIDFNGLSW
jgi:superfamily II DNA or RNA helicase